MKIKRIRHIRKAPFCEVDFSELKNLLDTIFEDAGLRFNDDKTARNKKVSDDSGRFTVPDKVDIARTIPHGYVRVDGIEDAPRPTIVELGKKKDEKKVPPSIFDIQCDRKFEDMFKQLFPSAIVNGKKKEQEPVKDLNVFIANRLTFLIQTKHPIIFDTSVIETDNNSMTIAVNVDKTFPKLDNLDDLGFITSECNRSDELQDEIKAFLDGTDFTNIYCFPTNIKRNEDYVMAVKFVIYPKRKHL